jgi:hypothetical protein
LLWSEGVWFLIKIGVCSCCSMHIWYLLSTKKWFIFYDDKLIGYEEIPELSLSLHM